MKFKKMAAALFAAVIVGSAAVSTFDSTAVVAAADAENTGITVTANGSPANLFKINWMSKGSYYVKDLTKTFEISVSEAAFAGNVSSMFGEGMVEVSISYLVDNNGLDLVGEISWDCDAILAYDVSTLPVILNPETGLPVADMFGLSPGYLPITVLDGDIAACETVNGEGDYYGYGYHLGSKNGDDYIGSGNGVYSFARHFINPIPEGEYEYATFSLYFAKPGTVKLTMKDRNASTEPTTPVEPTDSTKEQSFHDDTTDISVDGSFPEGTSLKTEVKQTSDTKVSWDITPVDTNGNKVQPNGTATVKVPLPESFKGKDIFVYRIEDGKYTALESTVEGDYIVFKTSHFSEYIFTTGKLADSDKPSTDNPDTGSTAAAGFAAVVLAGAALIVSKKKR